MQQARDGAPGPILDHRAATAATTVAAASSMGGPWLGRAVSATTGWPQKWCIAVCAIAISIALVSFWLFVFARMYVRPLRRALSDLGYDVCVRCGCFLRGLPDGTVRCPECGTARERTSDPT